MRPPRMAGLVLAVLLAAVSGAIVAFVVTWFGD
jgi:hypothetical protein